MAQIYELLGSTDLAVNYYAKASRLAPEDYRVQIAFGECLLLYGQPERALQCFTRASSCNDCTRDIDLKLGSTYNQLGQYRQAAQHYRKYLGPEFGASPISSSLNADDPEIRSAILVVAKDEQNYGDPLKATILNSLLSKSRYSSESPDNIISTSADNGTSV